MNIHIYYRHFLIDQITDSTVSQIPNQIAKFQQKTSILQSHKPSDTQLKELKVWQRAKSFLPIAVSVTSRGVL